jgi:segregation and condensation protein B
MSVDTLPAEAEHKEPNPDHVGLDLPARIEALLFVADEPTHIEQLAQALEVSEGEVVMALQELEVHCRGRGLRLQRTDRQVQFATAPEAAPDVQRFLGLESSSKLSAPALETLALVAYRQPITRPQIEAIRGVNCDSVLRTLLSRGLVAAQGRLDQVGRPIVYGTTFEFLQYFGLSNLAELPAWENLGAPGEGELGEPGREADEESTAEEVRASRQGTDQVAEDAPQQG